MAGLPWGRLDANIWHHDKMVDLEGRRNGDKAFRLYVYALAWSVGTGADGRIPSRILPMLRATRAHADTLVDVGLWAHAEDGAYVIHNYAERQQISEASVVISNARRVASCSRWMREGKPCSCGTHT